MTDEVFGTPDADGWYEWKGNGMVRPAGKVDVVFDDGCVIEGQSADRWVWLHSGPCDDIVKWRPAQ